MLPLLIEAERLLLKLDGTDLSQSLCDFSPFLLRLFDLCGHNGARLFPLLASRISSQVYGTTESRSIAAKPRTRLRVQTNPWSPKARASPSHLQNREVARGPCHEFVYNPKTRARKKILQIESCNYFSVKIIY